MQHTVMETELGPLCVQAEGDALCRIGFAQRPWPDQGESEFYPPKAHGSDALDSHHVLDQAIEQLSEYFAGRRREFTLALSYGRASAFQHAVWDELQRIGFGHTVSYGQIAQRIGRPKAARAVGMANHHNPLPIVIACHRVVGANGTLGGYGGGVRVKQRLLDHEQRTWIP